MSKNHQFPYMKAKKFKSYRKTCICMLVVRILDPRAKENEIVECEAILETKFKNFHMDTKEIDFVYEDEALETYSAQADDYLRRMNTYLWENGLLEEIVDDTVSNPEYVTQDVISRLATMSLLDLQQAITTITSPHVLSRVSAMINQLERPAIYTQTVNQRIEQLNS